MVKIRIPNTRGHYEMEGYEIDVDDRDIIIRTATPKKERFHRVGADALDDYKPDAKKPDDDGIFTGPIFSRLLGTKPRK